MPSPLAAPRYRQGFARHAGESAYPGLWRGLIGAWMPGLGHTGDTLFDWSSAKHHGSIEGASRGDMPAWVIKPGGYALLFPTSVGSGATSHIDIGTWAITTGRMSIVTRARCAGAGVGDTRILSKAASTTEHDWMLGNVGSTTFRTRFKIGGTIYTDTTVSVWTETTRARFVVGRFDGANVEHIHFRQGSGVDALPMTIAQFAHPGDMVTSGGDPVNIGRNPGASPYGNWAGDIHFVYIYNRAITDAEVMTLYNDNYALFRVRRRVFTAGAAPPAGNPWFFQNLILRKRRAG